MGQLGSFFLLIGKLGHKQSKLIPNGNIVSGLGEGQGLH